MIRIVCCIVAMAVLLAPCVSGANSVKHVKIAHSGSCVLSSQGVSMTGTLGRAFSLQPLRYLGAKSGFKISESEGAPENPADVALGQAFTGLGSVYPNPFGRSTSISYMLDAPSHVSIRIYDVSGRMVRTLVEEMKPPGELHVVTWDGTSDHGSTLHGGVYFCRFECKGLVQTKKLVLLNRPVGRPTIR